MLMEFGGVTKKTGRPIDGCLSQGGNGEGDENPFGR